LPARRRIPGFFCFYLTLIALAALSLAMSPARAQAQSRTYVLRWTAPGDDSTLGHATAYDIRFSLFPITANNWSGAYHVPGAPTPAAPGTPESMALYWLNPSLTYYFAIEALDDNGNASRLSNVLKLTPVQLVDAPRDSVSLRLSAPWPNPARSSAHLSFALPQAGAIEIDAFDVAGHRVRTLASGTRPAGVGDVRWDLNDDRGLPVAAGVYYLRAHLPGLTTTRSLVVVH
jgi:FlgD Ig-like domain